MLGGFAKTLFGSSNDRYVKSLGSIVNKINGFEPVISAMSDEELSSQTVKFRERLANGEKLDEPAPRSPRQCARRPSARSASAITTCRWSAASCSTAARSPKCAPAKARRWSRRSATYPQRAGRQRRPCRHRQRLSRQARRGNGWAKSTSFLGLTVGVIIPNLSDDERREAYATRTSPTARTTSSASIICATT